MGTDAPLSLPPDEHALLAFLSVQAGTRDEFVARKPELLAQLKDCSPERFHLLAKRLEFAGLISCKRVMHVGTLWQIHVKVPDAAMTSGDHRFAIPQNLPSWPSIRDVRKAELLAAALPLVRHVPRERKPILRFRRRVPCEFFWTVVDAEKQPAKNCSVHASLLLGRSQLGLGGVAVDGFNNLALQHIGEGEYCRRGITITAPAGSNYVTTISAHRDKKPFGWWEECTEIYD
jgi:hypothetical protein